MSAFDPWTSSAAEALLAADSHPEALAQHQAASEVLQAHDACLTADGGCTVLQCMRLCAANRLTPPQWLADAFISRLSRVQEAEVASWDDAFGRPWPPRTRLHAIREQRRLKRVVHAAVWEAVLNEGRAVNRILFDEIGERREVAASGSTCEDAYYEALREGMPNPAAVRAAQRFGNPTLSRENAGLETMLEAGR